MRLTPTQQAIAQLAREMEPFPVRIARHELEEAQLRSTAKALEESEAAAITAQYDAMTLADKAREFHKTNDEAALRFQVEQGRNWGML